MCFVVFWILLLWSWEITQLMISSVLSVELRHVITLHVKHPKDFSYFSIMNNRIYLSRSRLLRQGGRQFYTFSQMKIFICLHL